VRLALPPAAIAPDPSSLHFLFHIPPGTFVPPSPILSPLSAPSPHNLKRQTNHLNPSTDSFLFLTLSLTLIACSLYLPEHVLKMWHRAFYYYSGHAQAGAATGTAALATASEVAQTVLENATAAVESV